jgi:hypothetical protein
MNTFAKRVDSSVSIQSIYDMNSLTKTAKLHILPKLFAMHACQQLDSSNELPTSKTALQHLHE